jgi:hypothetical protein
MIAFVKFDNKLTLFTKKIEASNKYIFPCKLKRRNSSTQIKLNVDKVTYEYKLHHCRLVLKTETILQPWEWHEQQRDIFTYIENTDAGKQNQPTGREKVFSQHRVADNNTNRYKQRKSWTHSYVYRWL